MSICANIWGFKLGQEWWAQSKLVHLSRWINLDWELVNLIRQMSAHIRSAALGQHSFYLMTLTAIFSPFPSLPPHTHRQTDLLASCADLSAPPPDPANSVPWNSQSLRGPTTPHYPTCLPLPTPWECLYIPIDFMVTNILSQWPQTPCLPLQHKVHSSFCWLPLKSLQNKVPWIPPGKVPRNMSKLVEFAN